MPFDCVNTMNSKQQTKIIVATHKKYQMPSSKIYLPLQVGASLSEADFGYQKDNTGDNISKKNKTFCELTGLYWAWKNLNADYVGLVHYRRYFVFKKVHTKSKEKRLACAINSKELKPLLKQTDLILPKKRNYYIESLYDHYAHTMYVEPLDVAGKVIAEKYPNYKPAFDALHFRKKAHMFNMLIAKKDLFDDYCEWLFNILFEVEKRVDISKYDDFHKRCFGRISELLLDVYIETNDYSYIELPVIDIEKVNWIKKGSSFLAAKFFGRKYDKSF